MTIPGPPPNGLSSTEPCTSVAKSRMLVSRYSTFPFSAARLGMLVPRIGAMLSDGAAYRYLPRSVAYLPESDELVAMQV